MQQIAQRVNNIIPYIGLMKFNKQLFLLFLTFINPVISQKTEIEPNKNRPIIQKEDWSYVFQKTLIPMI